VLWGLFALAFLLRGFGLASQPPLADEVATASIAENYLHNGWLGSVMWYHPPLRNYIVFLSGKLFGGYSAWGLRFGSVALGSLTVPFAGYLAWSLFRCWRTAWLSGLFLCIDPLHIYASREAFQFSTDPFFIVVGMWAAYVGIRRNALGISCLSGLLFGLASASKWHGLFPWFVSAIAYWTAPWTIPDYPGDRRALRRGLDVLAAFVAIPVTVYVATHIPWMLRGHSLADFADLEAWFVEHQYVYKGTEYDETVLPRRAWLWFVWPAAWMEFVFHEGKAYLAVAMGNLLVWFLTLPALASTVRQWLRERNFASGFLVAVFLCSYLPLVLTTRSIWVISASSLIPMAFILSANAISFWIDRGYVSKRVLAGYLCAVLLLSALMYPMVTGRTLEFEYLKPVAEKYSPH